MKKFIIFIVWAPLIGLGIYQILPKPTVNVGVLGYALFLKEKIFKKSPEDLPLLSEDIVHYPAESGGEMWVKKKYCLDHEALKHQYDQGVKDATESIVKNLVHEMAATIIYNGQEYKVTLKKGDKNVDRNYSGVNGNSDNNDLAGYPNSETDGERVSGDFREIQ